MMKNQCKSNACSVLAFVMVTLLLCTMCACAVPSEANANDWQSNKYPVVTYHNSSWNFDPDNREIAIRPGYILNQAHSYDIVETSDGYDLVIHFIKDDKH